MKKLVVVSAWVVCAATVVGAQSRRFSADDLVKLVRVSDPQISPDGKTIAIVVGRANLKEDRWDSELEFVDVATRQARVMTHDRPGVGWVRWSPDGSNVLFLAQDGNKKSQVFVMPANGGDAVMVTHGKTAVSVPAWRPDGTGIAFAAVDEEPEKKDEAKFEDAFEVGNNNYLERARSLPVHIWMVEQANTVGLQTGWGEAKRLTKGDWSLPVSLPPAGAPSPLVWTLDGKSLVFVKASSPITGDGDSSRLTVLDVASGAMRGLTNGTVAEGGPMLSPDGKSVAYAYPRDGKRRNLESAYVAPVAGGVGADVAYGLDRQVSGAAWMPDGRALVLEGVEGTHDGMWLQPLLGKPKRIDLAGLDPAGSLSVGKDGAVAFVATDAGKPAELYYMPSVAGNLMGMKPGDRPVRMTHLQTATDGMELGKQETITWKSDAWTVDGVLTYPPGYVAGSAGATKLPMVVYLHGGPTAVSLETFSTASQIFAAQGWLVFEPNYRGSNNEGSAFAYAIVNDASAGPGRDVMAGVEAVKAKGIVDEGKIAVSGWSYGGQMTAWMIGNYPGVWKAAVAGAPVTDLVDQYSLSDNNVERAAGYGPSPFLSEANMKAYAAESPITYAWRIKTPTLIMSDGGDWRVTTTQAYKLYHALKDNGVTVKFVSFPVPGHSPADPIRSRDVWRRWTAWLQGYLGAGVAAK
jgi:dipeptidyl aminopeptidase/acylaminoacyl peptidase